MNRWALLVAAIACEVSASLSLKGALTHPWLYVVVVAGYLAAVLLLGRLLRDGMGVGVAYGIWGALGVASTAVLSAVVFGEALTALKGVGIALIIAGVLVVELGSQRALEREPARESPA